MRQDSFTPVKTVSWYIHKHADSQIVDFTCGNCWHVNNESSFFHARTSSMLTDEYAVISECSACHAHNSFWEHGHLLTEHVRMV